MHSVRVFLYIPCRDRGEWSGMHLGTSERSARKKVQIKTDLFWYYVRRNVKGSIFRQKRDMIVVIQRHIKRILSSLSSLLGLNLLVEPWGIRHMIRSFLSYLGTNVCVLDVSMSLSGPQIGAWLLNKLLVAVLFCGDSLAHNIIPR